MARKPISTIRYSIRVPPQLDAKVRAFASSRDKTLSNAIISLLWAGLRSWAEIEARNKPDDDLTPGN